VAVAAGLVAGGRHWPLPVALVHWWLWLVVAGGLGVLMRFRAVRFAISVHLPRHAKTRRTASPGFWNCARGVCVALFHAGGRGSARSATPPPRVRGLPRNAVSPHTPCSLSRGAYHVMRRCTPCTPRCLSRPNQLSAIS
jgi:hypothetical protein